MANESMVKIDEVIRELVIQVATSDSNEINALCKKF